MASASAQVIRCCTEPCALCLERSSFDVRSSVTASYVEALQAQGTRLRAIDLESVRADLDHGFDTRLNDRRVDQSAEQSEERGSPDAATMAEQENQLSRLPQGSVR